MSHTTNVQQLLATGTRENLVDVLERAKNMIFFHRGNAYISVAYINSMRQLTEEIDALVAQLRGDA
jgi:hypothetical protein